MKYILPSYLIKELFKTFVPAFCGFILLIILGLTMQLLHKGLDIIDIRAIIPHLVIFACPNALPIAFLAATVMSYGRLSSSNEIAAIRTSGVHLHVIITPVIILGVLLSFLTFYLNAEVLPKSHSKIKVLKETAVSSILSRRISTVNKKIVFEPYHIYIGKVENNMYKDLAIIEYFEDYVTNILLAEEGTIVMANDGRSIVLTLRNGDFAKMNYKRPTEIPKVGTFDEMSFEIPVNKEIITTSKKYQTLFELFRDKKIINTALEKYVTDLNFEGKEMLSKTAKKKLSVFKEKHEDLITKQDKAGQKLEMIKNRIAKNKSNSEKIKNEIGTIENQIAMLNIDRKHFQRNIEEHEEELDQTNKTIEFYSQKKMLKEKELIFLQDSISINKDELDSANVHSLEIENQIAELESSGKELTDYSNFEKGREMVKDLLVQIHKRLSASFLCITFALIGIPLGILTRSGNILISFGISFLLVILVYYPLSVVGVILAKEGILPLVPSIWGANGIIALVGLILFKKSLGK
ncbi:MAG: LptF/LptG family permease [Candidatus Anammoxibacter sp.]